MLMRYTSACSSLPSLSLSTGITEYKDLMVESVPLKPTSQKVIKSVFTSNIKNVSDYKSQPLITALPPLSGHPKATGTYNSQSEINSLTPTHPLTNTHYNLKPGWTTTSSNSTSIN